MLSYISSDIWRMPGCFQGTIRGGKNRQSRGHCSQEMLNSCRFAIEDWKETLTLVSHMHYMVETLFLELKTIVSQNTICLCTCRCSTKILRWSAGNFCLQVVLPGRKLFFPALRKGRKIIFAAKLFFPALPCLVSPYAYSLTHGPWGLLVRTI
jgi:hypothetical protein